MMSWMSMDVQDVLDVQAGCPWMSRMSRMSWINVLVHSKITIKNVRFNQMLR